MGPIRKRADAADFASRASDVTLGSRRPGEIVDDELTGEG